MKEGIIKLIQRGQTKEDDESTEVFAIVEPTGRDEFEAAGQFGMKAECKFTIWAFEYDEQTEVEYNNKTLTIYRTYERDDERVELYAAERAGNGSKG